MMTSSQRPLEVLDLGNESPARAPARRMQDREIVRWPGLGNTWGKKTVRAGSKLVIFLFNSPRRASPPPPTVGCDSNCSRCLLFSSTILPRKVITSLAGKVAVH